jgi:ribonuclease HI
MVVKTKQSGTLLDDLKETFANLRCYRMKLSPEKCTFGMPAGQLLGYIISQRGIEANPSKIKAIEALELPTQLGDVQKFAGCLASLSRFVSRLGKKVMPLYQLMKKTDHFIWSQRADDAFNDLKRALSTAPILAVPAPREPMLLYIAATPWVISVVIVVEQTEEGKELPAQRPVYYLSEVLTLSKQNYPHYQKVMYGVYMAAKKLKHYFEEHPIMVVSTTPLSEIIGCKDATGRVAKWAIELAAHTIQYKPRTTIKSQIIADFFADWGEHQYLPPAPDSTHWRMNFDGSKMLDGLGAGVILTSPKGDKLQYVLQIHFRASNNVTEYEALVHGLKMAKEIGIQRILYYEDSDLVVHQVSRECAVTQHTTACCSMQVVDITLAEQASTNITSLRKVQQKHCGPKYKLIHILLQTKA